MTFLLSPQLDSEANPQLHWDLYRSYLENNKNRLPTCVFETWKDPRWSGGSDSYAPYYSVLSDCSIENVGMPDAYVRLRLDKSEYLESPIRIEVEYRGVLELSIDHDFVTEGGLPFTWRYNQFLVFDPWHKYEHNEKMFTHQIEWVGGNVWSITAKEVRAKWIESTT